MLRNIENHKRILLGLTMLLPGLWKLFVMKSPAVVNMLTGLFPFSLAPSLFAFGLIFGEILFGIAILSKYKIKEASYGAAAIILLATLTVHIKWSDLSSTALTTVLVHLVVVSSYLLLCKWNGKK